MREETESNLPLDQIYHDANAQRWTGRWFLPIVNARYMIPENASNHREHCGRKGTCIARRVSSFNKSWALIGFDDLGLDKEAASWIRTIHLIPVDE